MKRALGALALVFLYLFVGLAPLSFMVVGSQAPPRPFVVELSVALGFVGLSVMALQFALVARFRSMAAPFGIDVLQRFHKEISFVALLFVLSHPILLVAQNTPRYLPLLLVTTAPWRARFATISLVLLLLLVSLSIWRRRLRVPYEVSQLSHGLLAVAVVGSALAHIEGVGYYTRGPVRQLLFGLMVASLVSILIWARIISPLAQLRRPWRVVRLQPERARSTTVVIEPEGHDGFSFKPGQFAWISRWPVAIAQHPFSFSSPTALEARGRAPHLPRRAPWGVLDGPLPGVWLRLRRRRSGHHAPVQHGQHHVRTRGRAAGNPLLRQHGLGQRDLPRTAGGADPLHAQPEGRVRAPGAAHGLAGRVGPDHRAPPAPAPAAEAGPELRVLRLWAGLVDERNRGGALHDRRASRAHPHRTLLDGLREIYMGRTWTT